MMQHKSSIAEGALFAFRSVGGDRGTACELGGLSQAFSGVLSGRAFPGCQHDGADFVPSHQSRDRLSAAPAICRSVTGDIVEWEAQARESTHTIALETFVPGEEIDRSISTAAILAPDD